MPSTNSRVRARIRSAWTVPERAGVGVLPSALALGNVEQAGVDPAVLVVGEVDDGGDRPVAVAGCRPLDVFVDAEGVDPGQPGGSGRVVVEVHHGSGADGVHEGVPVDAELAGGGGDGGVVPKQRLDRPGHRAGELGPRGQVRVVLGPDAGGAAWFAAAPASLAPDQLHRGGEAGCVGQVVSAPAVIGGEDPAVAAGDDPGAFGLDGQAQQPARMLGIGVEALNGDQVCSPNS